MARTILIQVAGYHFSAPLELEAAPQTCAVFLTMLPLTATLAHGRWSGEACLIPCGDLELDLGYENHTTYPAPGHLLLYTGALSGTEILFPYGTTVLAGKVGPLAGNHFATLGKRIVWGGGEDITSAAR